MITIDHFRPIADDDYLGRNNGLVVFLPLLFTASSRLETADTFSSELVAPLLSLPPTRSQHKSPCQSDAQIHDRRAAINHLVPPSSPLSAESDLYKQRSRKKNFHFHDNGVATMAATKRSQMSQSQQCVEHAPSSTVCEIFGGLNARKRR